MTIYEIGFLMIFWAFTVIWFYTLGVNSGYTDGRRAVRMQLEEAKKVRV